MCQTAGLAVKSNGKLLTVPETAASVAGISGFLMLKRWEVVWCATAMKFYFCLTAWSEIEKTMVSFKLMLGETERFILIFNEI